MPLLDRFGLGQRIVLAVGLGLALLPTAAFVRSLGNPFSNFGWFGYAPLTSNAFLMNGGDLNAWQQFLVWIGAVVLWTAAALIIFKRPSRAFDGQP